MAGTFESPVTDGEYAVIEGEAPVSEMRDYAMDVNQYTPWPFLRHFRRLQAMP